MDILVDSIGSGVKFCVGWWSREVERTILDPFRGNSIFDPDWFRSARLLLLLLLLLLPADKKLEFLMVVV